MCILAIYNYTKMLSAQSTVEKSIILCLQLLLIDGDSSYINFRFAAMSKMHEIGAYFVILLRGILCPLLGPLSTTAMLI